MKPVHAFALVPVIAALGGFALAVQGGAGPGARPTASAAVPVGGFAFARSSADMARMDAQMAILRQLRDKATDAETPAEHAVLVAARTKAIRNAMAVMNETSSGGMSDGEGDGTAQRQMLEKRLEMTQIALQLTTDLLAAAPPK